MKMRPTRPAVARVAAVTRQNEGAVMQAALFATAGALLLALLSAVHL